MGLQFLGILDGNLHNNLQVLAKIDIEHLAQAFKGLVDIHGAKVVDEPVSGQLMALAQNALDVMDVREVLESLNEKKK